MALFHIPISLSFIPYLLQTLHLHRISYSDAPVPAAAPAVSSTGVADDGVNTKLLIKVLMQQEKTMKKQEKTMAALLEIMEEIVDKDCYGLISASTKPKELTKNANESEYDVFLPDL